jgi:hypothetical protein
MHIAFIWGRWMSHHVLDVPCQPVQMAIDDTYQLLMLLVGGDLQVMPKLLHLQPKNQQSSGQVAPDADSRCFCLLDSEAIQDVHIGRNIEAQVGQALSGVQIFDLFNPAFPLVCKCCNQE